MKAPEKSLPSAGDGRVTSRTSVLASNFGLGTGRAYARDDGTPTWEPLEEVMGLLEGGGSVAKAQLKGFGTLISFDVEGGAAAADAVCRNVRLIHRATGLGAVESTLERRAAFPGQGHLPPPHIRLSVGIEHVEDTWADLDRALRAG